MKRLALPGMTLGATSFLLPADYVPALRFAAPLCEDIALLLLECGAQGEYLPAAQDVDQMAAVLEAAGSRLHVHLPTASDCSSAESTRNLVRAVRMAVARSAPLQPHSFVLHVDFACLRQPRTGKRRNRRMDPAMLTAEQRLWTRDALDQIADLLPDPRQLAIENLEGFCPDFWDQWLAAAPAGHPSAWPAAPAHDAALCRPGPQPERLRSAAAGPRGAGCHADSLHRCRHAPAVAQRVPGRADP